MDKEIEEARKKQAYSRGLSPTASAHRQGAWTPAQNKLAAAMSNRSLPFKLEEEFTRPEEFKCENCGYEWNGKDE